MININIYANSYTCGDGCCQDFWDEVEIDGKFIMDKDYHDKRKEFHYLTTSGENELKAIIEAFGVEVIINHV